MILRPHEACVADRYVSTQGKYKYNEWKKFVDKGTTHEEAQSEYVELIEKLKGKYGFKE